MQVGRGVSGFGCYSAGVKSRKPSCRTQQRCSHREWWATWVSLGGTLWGPTSSSVRGALACLFGPLSADCARGHSHGHCLSPGAAAAGIEGVALSPRWGPHTRLDPPRCSAALLVPHDISLERRAPRPAWMAAQGLSPSPRSGLTQPTCEYSDSGSCSLPLGQDREPGTKALASFTEVGGNPWVSGLLFLKLSLPSAASYGPCHFLAPEWAEPAEGASPLLCRAVLQAGLTLGQMQCSRFWTQMGGVAEL